MSLEIHKKKLYNNIVVFIFSSLSLNFLKSNFINPTCRLYYFKCCLLFQLTLLLYVYFVFSIHHHHHQPILDYKIK